MRSRQALVVARREFLERVRTKWFAVVTLLGPIAIVAVMVLPAYFTTHGAQEEVHIDVVDHSGRDLGAGVAKMLALAPGHYTVDVVAPSTPDKQLLAGIRDDKIDGYLVFPKDTLSGGKVIYRGDDATNMVVVETLQAVVNTSVRAVRAVDKGISPEQAEVLLAKTPFSAQLTTGTSQARSGAASYFVGYAVMFILYIALVFYGVNVMRSVVVEKTSRVVEIVVSAVKPRALMLGKIVGVGAVGLLQLLVWIGMALALMHYKGQVLGFFGVKGAGSVHMPSLGVGTVAVVVGYFLLGYFFYAALYAAVGAMVSSEQEAAQAQMPITLLLVIPVLCVQLIANDPRGVGAQVLTLIPFSSPMLMPMRYLLGGVGTGGVLLSFGILAVSLAGAVWLSARIYRIGILSYGKRPSLSDLVRWLRA